MEDALQRAVRLIDTGQYEAGLKELKAIQPMADDDTLFQISLLYSEWGMAEDAYKILNQLHKRKSGNSHIILQLAEVAIDLDKEDEAIDYLLNIHQLDENYLSSQVLLADLYQAQGLEEAAERHLLMARKSAPEEPILKYALAEFYATTGRPGQAIPLYKDVLHEEALEHENVQLKLAEALSFHGQFEEAEIYYKKGLEKDTSLDGLFGYAVTAMRTEHYQTAIKALEELKEMDPQYSTLYPILADAYKEEGAIEEALKTLEEGLQLDEHNERMYMQAAELSRHNNDDKSAETFLLRLLATDPEHAAASKMYIEIKREADDHEEIIHYLTENPTDDPELTWYLADAKAEEEQLEDAIKLYKSVYDNLKDNPDYLKNYGEASWETGEQTLALKLFQESLKFDPENESLRAFVERIQQDF